MKQITLAALFLVALPIHAQNVEQRPLIGLRGVAVRVAVENHDNMPARLGESAMQTATELQLRKAGFNVAKSTDAPAHAPRLLVAVNAIEYNGAITYGVIVSLIEQAVIKRNGESTTATVWQSDALALTGDTSTIRRTVSDEVDGFINDWLAANPKR